MAVEDRENVGCLERYLGGKLGRTRWWIRQEALRKKDMSKETLSCQGNGWQ